MDQRELVLKQLYQARFSSREAYRKQVWRIICNIFFSRYVPKTATVLDVGAGWGEFISSIEAQEKFAMDLNPETKDHLPSGITFLHQDCSQPWPVESGTLDVVFTSNFLEHLPDKPSILRTVAEAYRCLKDNGLIIVMGPNFKYVSGKYWDFWDHHIPLTELSCVELLMSNGFTIVRTEARFLPYSMSNGSEPALFLIKLYLRFPILWLFFGKQFLVIGRKTSTPNGDSTI